VGGREQWVTQGVLEAGAQRATNSAFQGRYVIRHPWTGPITCKSPMRGMWGGNPAKRDAERAILASNMSFAAPKAVDANTLIKGAPPTAGELGATVTIPSPPEPAASASAAPSASTSAAPSSSAAPPVFSPRVATKSGCNAAGGEPGVAAAGLLALFALWRGRRRKG